ncbi:SDR family oxidoreductase [Chryseobacterium sp.]|jgi:NAD(P)-dependent dehydrogenase (short-subunit alcohol dehydrogenase family)|uniref:SDR family oxidoreductase n=1 Tax=Chryseobacterium sp. TaxID=1871047 RepID=UPI00283DE890|nr:SDR family oxidoreductase [Chryseobacterium sp.]MDR3025043.1 SDR family oxidoreductase [Chryseobacterium sp.]
MSEKKKIALVTGASRGLGKNMAINLAKKGINVIFTYQSKKEDAIQTAKEIEKYGVHTAFLQLDVKNIHNIPLFFKNLENCLKDNFQTDRIDYLINNAGIGEYATFAETTEEQFDSMFNIHIKGTYFLSQSALKMMNNGGGIINISSGLTRFYTQGYAAYAAAKGAVEILTKYQAAELGSRGIRVNAVAPGPIETDFGGGVVRDNRDLNQIISSQTALGRVGLPDDIGSIIAFLCTDEARWINAQRIEVSGGYYL